MLLSNLTNYRRLFRHLARSLFRTRGTNFQLSGTRIRTLAVFAVVFPIMHITALLGFLLDELLYRSYRSSPIVTPTFILGNFRSGSTFLHRLLALDDDTFSSFRTWEIYLAPSVSQRKFLRGVLIADRLIGSPVRRAIVRREHAVFEKVELHRVGLNDAEEDEGIFLYIWSGLFVWFFFPVDAAEIPFVYFERDVSNREKRRMMTFYTSCVRRHLFAGPQARSGSGNQFRAKIFLSKNPSFSPKLPTLLAAFPDARFIYLARNPSAMIPSEAAWLGFTWHYFATPKRAVPFVDEIAAMAAHWYTAPLEVLDRLPARRRVVLKFEDLVQHPVETVREIYRVFGMVLTEDAARRMETAARRPREMTGTRRTLEEIGLDTRSVAKRFDSVLRRFGYSAGLDETP